MTWLDNLPTTNARAAVSLALASVFVLTSLTADIAGHAISENTLGAVSFFLFGMMASDVSAFAFKRFSDRGLAEAKAAGPSPVTVEAPSSVSVKQSDGPGPMVNVKENTP